MRFDFEPVEFPSNATTEKRKKGLSTCVMRVGWNRTKPEKREFRDALLRRASAFTGARKSLALPVSYPRK
jgi:hypothetical protein